MDDPICGADCAKCGKNQQCGGCARTGGSPFGGACPLAACCREKGLDSCRACPDCTLRRRLIAEFESLNIPDLGPVTRLYPLNGDFINLPCPLPGGGTARLLDDRSVYLGAQVEKAGSHRCYGLAADSRYLAVYEYDGEGGDPEIVVLRRRDG